MLGAAAAVVGLGLVLGGIAGEPALTAEELRALGYRPVDEPREIGPFDLVDGRGQPFNADRLAGHWSFVFFGYANCPDICPVTLSTLAETERLLGPGRVQTVLVSVDPERDSPADLDAYVSAFSSAFVGATGTPAAVRAFAAELGASFIKNPAPGSELDYLVDHTGHVAVVAPDARLVGYVRPPFDAERLARMFRSLTDGAERDHA